MLDLLVIPGLNHLLKSSSWARTRLLPFAGRHARFEMQPLSLGFIVSSEGFFAAITDDVAPDVTIRLPADTPFLLPQGLDKVMAVALVEGNAEFATELSFILRNLRWDAEEDLSRLIGDIAARRLVKGAGQFAAWQKQVTTNFAENLAEYLAYENPILLTQRDFNQFRDDLARFTADLSKTEARSRMLA